MTESNEVTEIAGLKLKPREERRIRAGHLWIFSNEVDTKATPLTAFQPGEEAVLLAANNKPLGTVYVNPNSLICARLVTRDSDIAFDQSLLRHRLKIALALRARIFEQPYYRLVFGESDGLPGLVVDRFDDVLVAQITTAGMERQRESIIAALNKVIKPTAILWRNDCAIRELEGLSRYVEPAHGQMPPQLTVNEGGLEFSVAAQTGQKTGWFFDQQFNRARLPTYVDGGSVLDIYAYVGAWGLRAAAAGAKQVTCVDISEQATQSIVANAKSNGLSNVTAVVSDGLKFMQKAAAEKDRYDLIILDPPAFIKRKKDLKQGLLAYRRINEVAMRLLSRDGILISCSCSYHLPAEQLTQLIQQAARHVDRQAQILEFLHQGPDHPIHPAIPETHYLKGLITRITRI